MTSRKMNGTSRRSARARDHQSAPTTGVAELFIAGFFSPLSFRSLSRNRRARSLRFWDASPTPLFLSLFLAAPSACTLFRLDRDCTASRRAAAALSKPGQRHAVGEVDAYRRLFVDSVAFYESVVASGRTRCRRHLRRSPLPLPAAAAANAAARRRCRLQERSTLPTTHVVRVSDERRRLSARISKLVRPSRSVKNTLHHSATAAAPLWQIVLFTVGP